MAIICAVLKPSPMRTKTTCLAVIALTMWLGGFGCAFCCATGLTESCCLKDRNAYADCGESGCCKQAKSKSTSHSEESISRPVGVIGCTLLPNQSRSLAPIPRVTNDLPDDVSKIDLSFAFIGDIDAPTLDPPSPLNRGGTYLRCCVLLI